MTVKTKYYSVVPWIEKHRCLVLWTVVLGFYVVGLWPFNFYPRNRVQWIAGENGIHLARYAIAYSEHPLRLNPQASFGQPTGCFAIEVWLQAGTEPSGGVPVILSLFDGRLPENLLIGQWKSGILIRAPLSEQGEARGYREIGIDKTLQKGRKVLVTVTADSTGTAFFVDGILVRRYPKYIFPAQLVQGQLILGNAATQDRTWEGNMYGLAFWGKSLSSMEVMNHHRLWIEHKATRLAGEEGLAALYLFDAGPTQWIDDESGMRLRLYVPERYQVLRKRVLSSPLTDYRLTRSYFKDVVVNILGFVPFGFIFFLHRMEISPNLGSWNILMPILLGAVISLSIELLQAFLPSRSSQLTDLFMNISGVAIGIGFALIAARYHHHGFHHS